VDELTMSAGAIASLGEAPAPALTKEVDLVPALGLTPMRCPDGFAAILVTCVDVANGLDHDGDVELLAGQWMVAVPQPDRGNDGDVILMLHKPSRPPIAGDASTQVDIEMRLLNGRRWQRVGTWTEQDNRWPHIVASTVSAIMGLHTDILELEDPPHRVRSASSQVPAHLMTP
jgi:hypothetical protein